MTLTSTDRIGIMLARRAWAAWMARYHYARPLRHTFDLWCDCTLCESIVADTTAISIRILGNEIAREFGLLAEEEAG